MFSLVGRDAELKALRAVIARTESGEGGAVLLVGEPGVGKSRLARAAAELAGQSGFNVMNGQGHASEANLAYAPVVDAIGRFLGAAAPDQRSMLIRDLNDLGRLFTGLGLAQPLPVADPALERGRLFGSLAHLLRRAAADRPVLLCLEDVHWIDATTLGLLDFLTRHLQDERFTLLMTARDVEAEALPELVAVLRSLRRLGLLEELAVGRLDSMAVRQLTRQALGGEPPAELAALVETRGGGIPLFIETMIQGLVESRQVVPTAMGWSLVAGAGRDVPPLVRDVILQRLERLHPSERLLIELVAVAGEALGLSVLVEACGRDTGAVTASLRLLRLAKLVAEELRDGDVAYSLTHPLIAEVASGERSEMERRQLHATLALALERLGPLNDLGRLARHYRLAGAGVDQGRALEVLLAAGERAMSLYANQEAVDNFTAALQRAGKVGRGGLLERLGEARLRVGDAEAAAAAWIEALELAEQGAGPAVVARLRGHLAEAEWSQGRLNEARGHLEAGIAAVRDTPHGELQLARLYQALAALLDRAGELGDLEATVGALNVLAGRAPSPEIEAEAALAAVALNFQRGDFVTCLTMIEIAVAAAASVDSPLIRLKAYDAGSNLATELGDHRLIRRFAQPALELAQQVGSLPSEMRARGCLAVASMMAGNWAESDVEVTSLIAFARRADIPRGWVRASAMRAQLLVARGELDEAESVLAGAAAACAALSSDLQLTGTLVLAQGWLAVERNDMEGGRVLSPALASEAGGLRPWRLATLGELLIGRGKMGAAISIADQLDSFNDGSGFVRAAAAALRANALVALGRRDDARALYVAAAEGFERLDIPWRVAQTRLSLAALLDDPAAAIELSRQCLATFEQLGARRWADKARRALRQLGVNPAPPRRRSSPSAILSKRELEVARLAAQGLTTAEIGDSLVISRHTAATHLQHIYQRLQVRSRVALARTLGDAGLL